MWTLAVEAFQTFKTPFERRVLNGEFENLSNEIQTISNSTTWRGKNLLDGSLGRINIQISINENQTQQAAFADINTVFGSTEANQAGIDGYDTGKS